MARLPDLEATLHGEAVAATGFSDFGDDGYQEGLGRLIDSLARSCPDDAELAAVASATVTGHLRGRLWSQEGWRTRPDSLGVAITGPVVIAGLPRTGTTMLHKLLSMDEGFQVLESWMIPNPMVRPRRETWTIVPEYRAAVSRFADAPEAIKRTHFVEPHEADECLAMMAQSFASNMFGSTHHIPDYDDWFLAHDMTPSLLRLADNLRLIAADEPSLPWLLKNPSHVLALDELFAVFPAARVVQTHRHPSEAIGSVVSLLSNLTGEMPAQRAERELRVWGEGARRAAVARHGRRERFFDVDYRDLQSDPMAIVESLYDWLGRKWHKVTEQRMRNWLRANPQGKHGTHTYDPARLGVTPEAVNAHFGDYVEHHGLDLPRPTSFQK